MRTIEWLPVLADGTLWYTSFAQSRFALLELPPYSMNFPRVALAPVLLTCLRASNGDRGSRLASRDARGGLQA